MNDPLREDGFGFDHEPMPSIPHDEDADLDASDETGSNGILIALAIVFGGAAIGALLAAALQGTWR